MNTSNARARHSVGASNRSASRWLAMAALLVSGLVLVAPALAQNTLKNMSYQVLPGGEVAVSLQFEGQAPEPTAFTTDEPPRIALDFANTTSTVDGSSLDIGTGATSAVTVATTDGRTRVVIDLFRASTYRTRVEGNTLVVDVANGKIDAVQAGTYAVTDPTKAPPSSGVQVSDIDFRRGENGAGKIIISFDRAGATADMRSDHGGVTVNLGRVDLPENLSKKLDVTDFATPVRFVETRPVPGGAQMNITTSGNIVTSAFQSGTQYVVTIEPQSEEEASKKEPELGPDGRPKPVYTGERVTFNFQAIPVRQILHLIAGQSGFNIVVSDTVSGSITLRLVNVPWDQALDIVLRAKGLGKDQQDNVIWVAPQEQIAKRKAALAEARQQAQQTAKLSTAYIPISYGNAGDIATLLTEGKGSSGAAASADGSAGAASKGFLSPRGSVTFDVRTNTLLVNDTPEKIREIRELVAKLDRPVQQVLIESRIVIASNSYARALGVRFGITGAYQDGDGNVFTSTGTAEGTGDMIDDAIVNRYNNRGSGLPVQPPSLNDRFNVNLPVSGNPAGSFGLAILGADYLLDLELSAAQTEGKSEIISSPRVITANQQPAVISQGQEIGYQTVTSAGGAGGQLPQVQFKDVTLKLEVTPTITADERVFLDLNVTKDSLAGFYDAASGQIPIIDTREIQTKVLVDNGATVVLGGILEINKTDSTTKVPVLGDIPVLGTLFRSKSKNSDQDELLVFVTPRILEQQFFNH